MKPATDIVIIGGGIVGASAAYHLNRKGRSVTILEKGAFGNGSSWGNCGLVVPSHVLPLNSCSNLVKGLRWMFKKDAPLSIHPTLDRQRIRWLAQFARRCNARDHFKGAAGCAPLLEDAAAAYSEWVGAESLECEWKAAGALHVFRNARVLGAEKGDKDLLARFGYRHRLLHAGETRRMAPDLAHNMAGAYFDPTAGHLRPDALMSSLKERLFLRGVRIHEHSGVTGFKRREDRIVSAVTREGEFKAESFVVAAGAWTPQVGRMLGCRIPIQPGKGFSMTLAGSKGVPSVPCFFGDRKVVATPFDNGLRLGGTLMFAGYDDDLDPLRFASLMRTAEEYLHRPHFGTLIERWCGWRPMTFDGMPIIGPVPGLSNATVAAGHNTLGITMAPATGRLVAEMVCGEQPVVDPRPYDPHRFHKFR